MNTDMKQEEVVPGPQSSRQKLRVITSSQLLVWLGLSCLFTALPLYYIKHALLNDPDIWWHMRAGEWMVQNHRILHVDPFSASTLGRPWVDYCWIFDAFAYWLVGHFDLVGIIWFQTVMRVVVAATLFSLLRNLTTSFWKALGVTGLAMLAMSWTLPPRPGAFSVLFFVLELHVLVAARRKLDPRWMWILPGLFVLWANIHIEFVTGLFMLGVLSLGPFLDRLVQTTDEPRTALDVFHRQLWYVFIASLLATLVNPYGPELWRNVFQYAGDTKIFDLIVEFYAMHFRTINDWAVLALLMLACFALGRVRPFRPAWALLLAWSAWMGFRSLREVWLVAILSAVVITGVHGEEPTPEESHDIRMSTRLAVAATVLVSLLAGASVRGLSSRGLLRQVTETFPVGAVEYIHRNQLPGPLLNELSWGGFLIYAVPEIPPAMDGRTNVHTQDEILRALPVWNGESGWEKYPELRHAHLVLSSHWWPLALLLRSDPRFRVVYEDRTSVLFEAVPPNKTESQPASQKPLP